MKALLLLLLCLVLGGVVLFLVLEPGRSPSTREHPSAALDQPAPAAKAGESERAEEKAERSSEAQRQSIDASPAQGPHTTYEGTVIGEGAPLAGARVVVQTASAPAGEASSDERGRFKLTMPTPTENISLLVQA